MKFVIATIVMFAAGIAIDQVAWDGENTAVLARLCTNAAYAVRDAGHEISSSILA